MAGMLDVAMGPIGMSGFADSFFGQADAAPYTSAPSLGAMLKKLLNKAPDLAAVGNAFDAARMPGQLKTQLGAEAMFDPGIAGLREATTQSFADQLALGGTIAPQDLMSLNQNIFERNSMSGLGGSGAGRMFAARNFAQMMEDLRRSRTQQAADWTRSSPFLSQFYQPNNDITPGFGASYDAARQNANNAYQQYLTQTRNQNTANMIDRPLGIVSTLAGAFGSLYGGGASPVQGMQYPTAEEYGLNNPSQFTPYAPVATPSSYGIQLRGTPGLRGTESNGLGTIGVNSDVYR
jgi:hypothetical protein